VFDTEQTKEGPQFRPQAAALHSQRPTYRYLTTPRTNIAAE
jgi:hypothetical protein